jgi:hypothetical protein
MFSPSQVKKMTVNELKAALAEKGASTQGLKASLVQRLLDMMEDSSDNNTTNTTEVADATSKNEEIFEVEEKSKEGITAGIWSI